MIPILKGQFIDYIGSPSGKRTEVEVEALNQLKSDLLVSVAAFENKIWNRHSKITRKIAGLETSIN
jgi:hypothetical protein